MPHLRLHHLDVSALSDFAVGNARSAMGVVLVHRDFPAERERGLEVLEQVRDMCLHGRLYRSLRAVVDGCTTRERARRGDRDAAIPLLREVVDDLFHAGQLWTCSSVRLARLLREHDRHWTDCDHACSA